MFEKQDISKLVSPVVTEDVLAHAERRGYFEARSRVSVEQNQDMRTLYDSDLSELLKAIKARVAERQHIGDLTIFIPGDKNMKGRPNQLCITADLFRNLTATFHIPSTFLQAAFDEEYISRACGLGLYGNSGQLELFYPCIVTGYRTFVYCRDLGPKGFLQIFLRPPPALTSAWGDVLAQPNANPIDRHPLRIHLLFLSQLATFNDNEMSTMRDLIVRYEKDEQHSWLKSEQKRQIFILHRLAQAMRIVAENCTDIEGMVDLLQRAHRRLGLDGDKHSQTKDDDDENNNGFLDTLQKILSRTEATRRWSMNYADRGKILIDLAFHIATQNISEVNYQDSTSMNTIAVMTLIFLPGTLVCAIFSTVFFDVTFDDAGIDTFHYSQRIWYFFAVTIPLTAAVLATWWVWKRMAIHKRVPADSFVTASRLRSGILGSI